MTEHMPAQLAQFERELASDHELVGRIMAELPHVEEPKRVLIRCSPENADRAIARALAGAVVQKEICKIQIENNDAETEIRCD